MSDSIEAKKQALDTMRKGFIALMDIVMQTKSAHVQKQQALLRFDEAHMWMQNGIMSYVETPEPSTTAAVPLPPEVKPEHHAIVPECQEQQQQEQTAVA